jgi:sugar phosphate isomerase/epimerase
MEERDAMKRPIGIQLYSVREAAEKDLAGTLKKIAKIGYHGVEFAGFYNHPVTEVARMLADTGLKAMSVFADLPAEENIARIVDEANILGTSMRVAGFGPTDMDSLAKVQDCIRKFKTGATLAKKNGLTLAMHNHWWEFANVFDGKTVYEMIMENVPDLCSELDIYWSTKGGADTLKVMKKWAGRFPMLHVKDGDLSDQHRFCDVGGGKIATREILQAADSGVKKLIVEQDNTQIDIFESIRKSFDWLVKNGFGEGK